MEIMKAERLAQSYSKLSEARRAYLSGFMDGLAFLHDQDDPETPAPEKKAVAAGPSNIR